jgi:NTP pyrophosphatase (non-canonical NTP hydrolase)
MTRLTVADPPHPAAPPWPPPREETPMDLDDFQRRVGEWGSRTFPKSTPYSKFAHLLKEVWELEDEIEPPGARPRSHVIDPARVAEEAADCLMLLLHLCHEQGVSLADAAEAKFADVQTRRWGEPDEHGVVEHVRTEG